MKVELERKVHSYETDTFLKGNKPKILRVSLVKSFLKEFDTPSNKFVDSCMIDTLKSICTIIPEAKLGYIYDNTMIIVIHDDGNNNFFNRSVMDICTGMSSMATLTFNTIWYNYLHEFLKSNNIEIKDIDKNKKYSSIVPYVKNNMKAVLHSSLFEVDTVEDVWGYLTLSQRLCFTSAVDKVYVDCFKEVPRDEMSNEDKIQLLKDNGVDFYSYGNKFYKGYVCFKTKKTMEDGSKKSIWLDYVAPTFKANKNFVDFIYTDKFI